MTLSGTQVKSRVWKLHTAMFGGMVFFEIILVMDCRIKMSLLTFRSHLKRRSVSFTGVQTITSHVLTFKACTLTCIHSELLTEKMKKG